MKCLFLFFVNSFFLTVPANVSQQHNKIVEIYIKYSFFSFSREGDPS